MKTRAVLVGLAATLLGACGSGSSTEAPAPAAPAGSSVARLSAGGGVLRGGGFVLQAELGGMVPQPAMSGGGFTLEAAGIVER